MFLKISYKTLDIDSFISLSLYIKNKVTMERRISMEGFMISKGQSGDKFYTEKPDRHITALANYYKRRVSTERVIAVTKSGEEASASLITKVTLI